MSDHEHVIFAECLEDLDDNELRAEYARLIPLPSSCWRTAVLREAASRRLTPETAHVAGMPSRQARPLTPAAR
jgi:hypothetical protein